MANFQNTYKEFVDCLNVMDRYKDGDGELNENERKYAEYLYGAALRYVAAYERGDE